ncbi:hypothetical protein EJD97_000983 [Solanum chilense]|uniref:CCHC-type domain-containing protein n=1 Tax=Solanum chilense TaxID=4083 RepID=A0A6N2C1G8_SOLCI|nr:hypothetical protein EJD97_000983 [Solanum chilense]
MNTRRNAWRGRGEAAAGGNQVPLWGPTAEMEMPVNPTGLTDREVSTVLVQMALDITSQAQAMTAKAKQQENLEEEYKVAMLHTIMGLFRLMIHVQQVEESRKRKHTRAGNRSRQVEKNFSRKSITKIRDKPRFKKGVSDQGESSSSKGCYDRDYEPRVKRNGEVDTPQERTPCQKCGKLHGGERMRGSNACYSCSKSGHMMNNCAYMRGQRKGKEKVQPNGSSEEAPRRQRLFALKSIGVGEDNSGDVSCA